MSLSLMKLARKSFYKYSYSPQFKLDVEEDT